MAAQRAQRGYYRHPTVHGRRVVFCADDDLWEVALRGGVARRLTSGRGLCRYPSLSPDGKQLAFVWSDEGASDLYVMPARGGEPRRLTWDAHDAIISGWSADGERIRYATNAGNPFQKVYGLREVPAAGGQPIALNLGPAHFLSEAPEPATAAAATTTTTAATTTATAATTTAATTTAARGRVLARHEDDAARWKRYRGGRAGALWIDPRGDGRWRRLLPKLRGQLVRPLWIADRVYFVSDHEGTGNLYSVTPRGTHLTRHTDHDGHFVRHPRTDGQTIVYHCGADLFAYDVAAGETRAVPVRFDAHRSQRARRFVHAGAYLERADVHPRGHSTLVTARGSIFAMGHWEGAVIQPGEPRGVRYRLAAWLADGKRVVAVSDAGGEECLEVHTLAGDSPPRRLDALGVELGRPVTLVVAPHGDRVAVTNHRLELLVIDLAAGTGRRVDASEYERVRGVAWSPCGRFLAYALPNGHETVSLYLADVAGDGAPVALTRTEFTDVAPAFDPAGRYLYFISYRDYGAVFDQHGSDLSFPMNARLCLVTLRRDLTSPFTARPRALDAKPEHGGGPGPPGPATSRPSPDAANTSTAGNSTAANSTAAKSTAAKSTAPAPDRTSPAPTRIDLDGIQDRVLLFPLRAARFGSVEGASDGRVLYTVYPLRGAMARGWSDSEVPANGTLRCYDLTTLEDEQVMASVSGFGVARDGKTVRVRRGRRLRLIGHKLNSAKDKEASSTKATRKTGWLDLGRLPVEVAPPDEWAQMLREIWRLMRDGFWAEDMSGVDWEAVWRRYSPLIERVGSRAELSDLVWTMQGELGTSHAYELGGDYRRAPNHRPGLLGADLAADATVERIIRGDTWDPQVSSPLAGPGIGVVEGDRIVAVNGQRVTPERPVPALLSALGGQEVQLTVLAAATGASVDADPAGAATQDAIAAAAAEAGVSPGAPPPTNNAPTDNAPTNNAPTDSAPTHTPPTASQADDAGTNASDPGGGPRAAATRVVTVRTLRSEWAARYRQWVADNRRRVHQASGGRLGYIHIPNMGPEGFGEFHRGFLLEYDRPGLVVDARFNRGGRVSSLLLEKLTRRRLGYDVPRRGAAIPYPFESPRGPMVALTNAYCGSDGDIFSHAWRELALGPLIGTRSWGGVVGIWPRHRLVDGSVTSQPEFAFWFHGPEWGVENHGVDPDVEVDISPADHLAGLDPQLDTAIKAALDAVEAAGEVVPATFDRTSGRRKGRGRGARRR